MRLPTRWWVACLLFLGWNLLFYSVALSIGISWSFHSEHVALNERLLSAGTSWQDHRMIAAILAQGLIMLFSWNEWKDSISGSRFPINLLPALISSVLIVGVVPALLVLIGSWKWIGLRPESFIEFFEPFLFFLSLEWVVVQVLGSRFNEKTPYILQRFLTSLLTVIIVWIWLEPTMIELLSLFLLGFVTKGTRLNALFIAFMLSLGIGFMSWSVFGLGGSSTEGVGVFRFEASDFSTMNVLSMHSVLFVLVVWVARLWYLDFYDYWTSRIERMGPRPPSQPLR